MSLGNTISCKYFFMNKQRIQAYLDLGSSATKGVYWSGGKFQWLWMLPQFASLSPNGVSRLNNELGATEPEARAWVKVGSLAYAVGSLARASRGNSGIALPKKERAVYKILAAIGVMAERLKLVSEFELDLGVVLPLDEFWTDRKELKEALLGAVGSFEFQGRTYRVSLNVCEMRPEGLGLYMLRRMQLVKDDVNLTEHTMTILMFGHRNLSILTFDKGSPPTESNSTSRGPGFVELLRAVANDLAVGIAPDDSALLEAVLSKAEAMRVPGRSELLSIKAATNYAFSYYLQQVGDFMLEHLPAGEVELLMAGGAAYQIRNELTKWFKERNLLKEVTWSDVLLKEFQYYLPDGTSSVDAVRYCDVFGLFKSLSEAYPIKRAAAA